jgi:NAD(P)H-flavin reductase
VKGGRVVSAAATGMDREQRICAVGRFVLPQVFEAPGRLLSHSLRNEKGVRRISYEEAVAQAAGKLKAFSGSAFMMITTASASRETLHVLKKFTTDVMGSKNFVVAAESGKKRKLDKKINALWVTGDHASPVKEPKVTIVSDILSSKTSDAADVVFAAAVLGEIEGTFLSASGEIRTLPRAADPPEGVVPDWKIVCDVARRMGAIGFDYGSASEITPDLEPAEKAPAMPKPFPPDDLAAIPRIYRGHDLARVCSGLDLISPKKAGRKHRRAKGPFGIVDKTEIVPNTHLITVHDPVTAEKCEAGQFVIAMANERSERTPLSISDWDREKGTVTMIVMEAGRSSRELCLLEKGDRLAHFAGPLGLPIEAKNYGTVVVAGGCYGVGAILPVARSLKAAGNRVICIEEASSHFLLHWEDKLSKASDEFIVVTKDGSKGIRGGVQEVIDQLVERGEKIDQAFVIGCTFMMNMVSDRTKEHSIPTLTALNPIMVDGTGMCGACRVTVGDTVKFACVDGPFLDGHQINWTELLQRRKAFTHEEVQALPQDHRPCGGA